MTSEIQKTHFADDDTLAYISRLERDRAELIEALRGLLLRYDAPYGSSPTAEDFKHTRALLSRLGAA